MKTVTMESEDEITRLERFVEATQAEFAKLKATTYLLVEDRRRYRALLQAVHDVGPQHSLPCDCGWCNAWRAIYEELSK